MTTDSMILGTPFGEHPTRILMLGSGNGDSVISTLREIPSHAQPLTTA